MGFVEQRLPESSQHVLRAPVRMHRPRSQSAQRRHGSHPSCLLQASYFTAQCVHGSPRSATFRNRLTCSNAPHHCTQHAFTLHQNPVQRPPCPGHHPWAPREVATAPRCLVQSLAITVLKFSSYHMTLQGFHDLSYLPVASYRWARTRGIRKSWRNQTAQKSISQQPCVERNECRTTINPLR